MLYYLPFIKTCYTYSIHFVYSSDTYINYSYVILENTIIGYNNINKIIVIH